MNLDAFDSQAREIIQRYDEPRAAMLPLLWLVQAELGHVPSEAEFWVGRHLGVAVSHVREVVSFYSMFRTTPAGRRELRVCTSLPCLLRGAGDVLTRIQDQLGVRAGETTPGGELTVTAVECLCACEIAPMAQLDEQFVGPLDEPGALESILRDALRPPAFAPPGSATAGKPTFESPGGATAGKPTFESPGGATAGKPTLESPGGATAGEPGDASPEPEPFVSTDGPVVSTRLGNADGTWFDAYVESGGYVAAKRALSMTPAQIIDEISRSNLRGLGGAGFPTAKKWSFIPKNSARPVYLVVNADEGEPGTFKDRYLLERDPHALLEGMIVAAYSIGSHKAYVYIRGEYFRSAHRFNRAVQEAHAHGWLGTNIQGSGFDLDVVIHRGAGAYICGEETALLTSLEGGKGFPKLKPPFPAISGLFHCPTIVNNVETLACVPFILREGAERFARLGTPTQGGTRLFSVCGHVKRPGLYEAPVGVSLRELVEGYGGGVRDGRTLKAVVPGGISAKVLTASEIDVQMDFDSLMAAGSMAGSGGVIVMDDSTCMFEALQSASKFFAHESCGQCSPCREGTGWVYRILNRIAEGKGRPQDLDELLAIARDMEGKTICVFADAAAWPVQSYITKFREEFEAHVRTGTCPARSREVAACRP